MNDTNLYRTNPSLIIRDDFDDFAILFDPHSGKAFGLNPIGELIWKSLKNEGSIENILQQIESDCCNIPETAESDVLAFIDKLENHGLIGRRI